MADRIDSKTARAKLKPRREPYWHQLRAGGHLGYRKLTEGEGTWIAKWRDAATGKRHYKALGTILDSDRPAFERARKDGNRWLDDLDKGVSPEVLTVKDACDQYVATLRRTNAKKGDRAAADFRRLVFTDAIASIELGKLRADHLEAWRDRVSAPPPRLGRGVRTKATPRAPATINRDMVPLRAALNRALDKGLLASDIAWRLALKPLKNADRRRGIYLDREERARLIEKAVDELKPFIKGLASLPLRPGALAALSVADFNSKLKTLRVGVDKAGAERWIAVPPATAQFLAEQAKGKLPGAPLIAMADGARWTKDRWKGPIRDAVAAAGLPAATTSYVLRHSAITDLVVGGLDLLTIAKISGTSVAMIEKFYGHLRQEQAKAALAALAL
ncbi:MAG: tyrosine-type recombinase/integrase [Burkholderiales bacterium]|nr:tyrosine-type recombinase/integrase [Burkholderiales bacterium]